jgi:hypothetical protein
MQPHSMSTRRCHTTEQRSTSSCTIFPGTEFVGPGPHDRKTGSYPNHPDASYTQRGGVRRRSSVREHRYFSLNSRRCRYSERPLIVDRSTCTRDGEAWRPQRATSHQLNFPKNWARRPQDWKCAFAQDKLCSRFVLSLCHCYIIKLIPLLSVDFPSEGEQAYFHASSIHSRRYYAPSVSNGSPSPVSVTPAPPSPAPPAATGKRIGRTPRDRRLLSDLWLMSAATFRRLGKIEQARGAIQEAEVTDENNPAVWVQVCTVPTFRLP